MERPTLKTKQNRRWEPAEVERMISMLLDGKGVDKVALTLQRSPDAVKLRATLAGVSTCRNLQLRSARNKGLLAKRSQR